MNAMHGLLAGDCTSDRKYIDEPGKKKEQKLADDAFKIANEFAKRFNELESKKTG